MIDLKQTSVEMDRGIFSYLDAVVIMNEYERLGLTGCEGAIDRIDHGFDIVDDLRAIHNAIEIAYAKARSEQPLSTEASAPQTLRQQVKEFFGGRAAS
jgi:hypothetical protein